MNLNFSKYQGAGNDFILIDNRKAAFGPNQDRELIKKLCDRRFGIGADGLMILQPAEGYDFEMLYYNADGNPGTMCGNGGRCIVAFARHLGIIINETNFLAVDGPHYAKVSDNDGMVSLQMIDVDTIAKDDDAFILNTGSPHYVVPADNLSAKDVFTEGRRIRYSSRYAEQGINVNFIEDLGGQYYVRTYERGVEDETLACGTGTTACVMVMALIKRQNGQVSSEVLVPGGQLGVSFYYDGHSFTNVFLTGPAMLVFQGHIAL